MGGHTSQRNGLGVGQWGSMQAFRAGWPARQCVRVEQEEELIFNYRVVQMIAFLN